MATVTSTPERRVSPTDTTRDVLGYRAKIGVVVPATGTTLEPELYQMAPPGVTFHGARLRLPGTPLLRPGRDPAAAAQAFLEGVAATHAALAVAVGDLATCAPDHVLIGISALAFLGGAEGHRRLKAALRGATEAGLTTAADAADAALRAYGARRVALLSPHPPPLDAPYTQTFAEAGYEVVALRRLAAPSALAIAAIDEAALRPALAELAGAGADAIVQLGTDVAMARLADEAERWLGVPVVAINAALLWHALRACGIPDRVRGFGTLLREH